jgi:zinc protease
MRNMTDRTQAPAPKGNITFEIPAIELLKTSNGIDVHFVEKNKLPIVQLIVMFSGGSKFDPADKKGITYLTSLLIDEGAGEFDAFQLNNEFEKLGSVLGITSDHDSFSFSLTSIKENFYRSFELLSKIINEPRMDEKDFEREKKKLLDRILQLKDEPSYIASTAFDKLIFDGNYYSLPEPGFESTVEKITLDDVKNFYRNTLLQSEIKLIAVGNISKEEISGLVEKFLPKNINNIEEPEYIKPIRGETKFYFIDKEDSAQSEIRIGHLSKNRDAEDFYATRIMNTILGGQFSSRINLNLREQKGFTYGASSAYNYMKNAGYFEVSTSVNIQNTGEAVSEILRELDLIKSNIKKEEIDFAKSYLIKQFPAKFETYTQVARNIVPLITHSLPMDYYNGYSLKLNSVSAEEIIKSANDNICIDNLIVLVVGDKKIIEPQLSAITKNLIELDIYGVPVN